MRRAYTEKIGEPLCASQKIMMNRKIFWLMMIALYVGTSTKTVAFSMAEDERIERYMALNQARPPQFVPLMMQTSNDVFYADGETTCNRLIADPAMAFTLARPTPTCTEHWDFSFTQDSFPEFRLYLESSVGITRSTGLLRFHEEGSTIYEKVLELYDSYLEGCKDSLTQYVSSGEQRMDTFVTAYVAFIETLLTTHQRRDVLNLIFPSVPRS